MVKRANRLNLLLQQSDYLQITAHFENIEELGLNQEANLLKGKHDGTFKYLTITWETLYSWSLIEGGGMVINVPKITKKEII